MTHAIPDPPAAWHKVLTLAGRDDDNTGTDALCWAATRAWP